MPPAVHFTLRFAGLQFVDRIFDAMDVSTVVVQSEVARFDGLFEGARGPKGEHDRRGRGGSSTTFPPSSNITV
jgi:hypothetical protein